MIDNAWYKKQQRKRKQRECTKTHREINTKRERPRNYKTENTNKNPERNPETTRQSRSKWKIQNGTPKRQ